MHRSDLTGIILAGGKSSRMGSEKGLIEFRGKPLIRYGIDLLTRYTEHIMISSANPLYIPFGQKMVQDDVAGLGPAAGIAAALKYSETTWNLVIACDLPFLEQELFDYLIENASGCQAIVPIHDGIMEPLAGLYNKNLDEHLANAVNKGNLALYKILSSCKVHFIDSTMLLKKYPRLFTNFNTTEEMMIN